MKSLEPGCYNRHELSNEEYHASQGISSSHLKCVHLETLKHYKHKYIDGNKEFEKTDAMTLGSYVHALLLDYESIEKEFIELPKMDRRTKVGKQLYAEFMAESKGKQVIKSADIETGKKMASALNENAIVSKILAGASLEETIVNDDPFCGIIKCRADILNEKLGFVADLKIANTFNFGNFEKEIRYRAYDLQAAFYCDQWSIDDFLIINIESEPPFDIVVYEFSQALLEQGRKKYNKAIDKLLLAREKDNWPGYSEQIILADLNKWEIEE